MDARVKPAYDVVTTCPFVAPSIKDTTLMRICIFGAGAVGSHFAVRLALAGHEVSCVMRGPHLEAVKAKGLTLRVGEAEFFRESEPIRRPGRAWSAGFCHQHAEGYKPKQPRQRP